MCGIAGIILKNNQSFNAIEKIIQLSEAIKHRGPDGEGFLVATKQANYPCNNSTNHAFSAILPYSPNNNILSLKQNDAIHLVIAHRRLSIIDLTESGHQPLCDTEKKYWITYNGELYNYLELKKELQNIGYHFQSETDTEVVLAAYAAWGFECTSRFNGMWAFCIYDIGKQICFMSRDRFGVKPFYYFQNENCFAFASEQKALVKAGFVKATNNQKVIRDYLLHGLIENDTENFFENIIELWPGQQMVYDLNSHTYTLSEYYHLKNVNNLSNDHLSDEMLIEKIETLLENAIRLRLRSDVEVGTCLSGGIDSSVIAAIIAANASNKVHTFTSVFRNNAISEEYFADLVNKQIDAKSIKIEPNLQGFLNEVDTLIYSQDAPIWNTSTYAQFKVMELAKKSGIKVVLDGQGADELFAGYHHHFFAKWQNLITQFQFAEAFKEIKASSKTIQNPFLFFAKEKIKQKHTFKNSLKSQILKTDFIATDEHKFTDHPTNVNAALLDDIYRTRLKTFLKCEDRCGMWHSVESRTPFSDDVDLINFMFSFNGNRKIQNGVSKFLLREASKAYLPKEIYNRYDKVGFETPMQDWMKQIRPQMLSEIKSANFEFVNNQQIHLSDTNNEHQNKLLFKLFVLSKWRKVFA
ncbi:MAG: asparagine synthase (glutamine-hydrolyzing) [Bacteroidota bacterium]